MKPSPSPELLGRCVGCNEPIFRHRTIDNRQIACETLRQIDEAFKTSTASSQESQRDAQVIARAFDQDPDVMRPGQLMRRLGYQHSQFGRLQQMGRFRHLESPMSQVLGVRVYSRRKVEAACHDTGSALSIVRKRA